MTQFELEGELRLRDLSKDKMIYKEEMENQLKTYETFQEGGARI